MEPGELYRHEAFYRSSETGQFEAKYLVLLATLPAGDLVARLLTSRSHARPERPACFHGHPYSSFYLGVLGGPLSAKSWVDLRYLDDFDELEFRRRLNSKRIVAVTSLAKSVRHDAAPGTCHSRRARKAALTRDLVSASRLFERLSTELASRRS